MCGSLFRSCADAGARTRGEGPYGRLCLTCRLAMGSPAAAQSASPGRGRRHRRRRRARVVRGPSARASRPAGWSSGVLLPRMAPGRGRARSGRGSGRRCRTSAGACPSRRTAEPPRALQRPIGRRYGPSARRVRAAPGRTDSAAAGAGDAGSAAGVALPVANARECAHVSSCRCLPSSARSPPWFPPLLLRLPLPHSAQPGAVPRGRPSWPVRPRPTSRRTCGRSPRRPTASDVSGAPPPIPSTPGPSLCARAVAAQRW